jgi:hypothetical protein
MRIFRYKANFPLAYYAGIVIAENEEKAEAMVKEKYPNANSVQIFETGESERVIEVAWI